MAEKKRAGMETKTIKVVFISPKLKKDFEKLEKGDDSQRRLYREIERAIRTISENPYFGIHVPYKLIPKEYIKKYALDNLWKYNLPNGWRLIYSLASQNEIEIVAAIIEWFNHKEYEKRFKYI